MYKKRLAGYSHSARPSQKLKGVKEFILCSSCLVKRGAKTDISFSCGSWPARLSKSSLKSLMNRCQSHEIKQSCTQGTRGSESRKQEGASHFAESKKIGTTSSLNSKKTFGMLPNAI